MRGPSRSRSRTTLAVLFGVTLANARPSRANDGVAVVRAGTVELKKTDVLVIEKEELLLSRDDVDVHFRFFNPSDQDLHETLAFPMPDVFVAAGHFTDVAGHFKRFSVEVDGKPRSGRRFVRAYRTGKDATWGEDVTELPVASG